jgi:hypothetical protein
MLLSDMTKAFDVIGWRSWGSDLPRKREYSRAHDGPDPGTLSAEDLALSEVFVR